MRRAIVASGFSRTLMHAAILAITALATAAQQTKPSNPETLLGAAIHQEEVDGNLEAAIATYKKVLTEPQASRTVVATALLRLGRCYEKLGSAESRKAYERIAREFADQTQIAAEARARLRAAAPAARVAMALKKVWDGPKVDPDGTISADGRYLSFVDWATGDLAVHAFATGANRRLTDNKAAFIATSDFVLQSAISRDGRQIAFSKFSGTDQRFSLWIVDFRGATKPRLILDNEDVIWIAPFDWSPDGKWIALQIQRKDRTTTQLGVISAAGGSPRILKSIDWRGAGKVLFSPDGRYLAFDPLMNDSRNADVFVIAADGSRETHVVENRANDQLMGWAPDGSRLIFTSDRNGAKGLWSLPIADGKPLGMPELIKDGVDGFPLGVSTSGTLYFALTAGDRDVRIGSIDFDTGRQLVKPTAPLDSFVGMNQQADWSPDGKSLVYVSGRDLVAGSARVLSIRSMETGAVRELNVNLASYRWPRWAPDGRSLLVYGKDLKGRQGIFRIDAQSGDATTVVLDGADEGSVGPTWSPDGRRIYYRRFRTGAGYAFIERDLTSGSERELFRRVRVGPPAVSPDGRYLAAMVPEPTKVSTVLLIPVDGGEPKEIFRASDEPRGPIGSWTSWTPDGRFVLIDRALNASGAPREVLAIPAAGGTPHSVEITLTDNYPIRVHPDGRQIAYVTGGMKFEVWALEHFLPARTTSKAAKK